jgi:hypothetical protein
MTLTRKPRGLKAARPCRYCGHVGVGMGREDRNHAGPALYSCRDVDGCGARIRAAKAAAGIVRHPADDLPF